MIVVRLKGGLGNQMFQYALGRVLSIKHNVSLAFNIEAYENTAPRPLKEDFAIRTYDLEVFNISGRVALPNEIPLLYRMYTKGKLMLIIDAIRRRIFRHKASEIHFEKFNPAMLNLGPNSYLDGFFQSYKYFEGYEDIIRKDFTFARPPAENIQNLKDEISSINSVCIHIRRTDYLLFAEHNTIGESYHRDALAYLSDKVKIDRIYVFSDDIAWCRDNVNLGIPTVFVGEEYTGEKDEGHMYLMSQCKHFIIANSTFSWWAAWLSENPEKIIIAPKRWFAASLDANTGDLIPQNWVRI